MWLHQGTAPLFQNQLVWINYVIGIKETFSGKQSLPYTDDKNIGTFLEKLETHQKTLAQKFHFQELITNEYLRR